MRIDDRVREAHLSHFCPGGLGLPVAAAGPVGPQDVPEGGAERWPGSDDHRLSVAEGTCGRCGHPLAAGQDVRRRLNGVTVHATCRPVDNSKKRGTASDNVGPLLLSWRQHGPHDAVGAVPWCRVRCDNSKKRAQRS